MEVIYPKFLPVRDQAETFLCSAVYTGTSFLRVSGASGHAHGILRATKTASIVLQRFGTSRLFSA